MSEQQPARPIFTSASCDVIIAIDWAHADAIDREWATELAVASLGWGTRFGSDFAPLFAVPDPDDVSMPSGVGMYAVRLEASPPPALRDARLVILLGPAGPTISSLAQAVVTRALPCMVRAGSVWASMDAVRGMGVVATSLLQMIDAIHDGAGATRVPAAPQDQHTSTPTTMTAAPPAPIGGTSIVNTSIDARVTYEAPRVAVIIPTYNRADYLASAIDSALAQTYPHVEIVVADDGSTDHTAAVAHSREGPRVRYLGTPHTNGPDTRNSVLAGVDAPFVVWLGDDDLLAPDCVASRVNLLAQQPTLDVIYGDLVMADANLVPTGGSVQVQDWNGREPALLAALFEKNEITEGGALVRTSSIRSVYGYDPAFPKAHDYEFWTRLVTKGTFRRDPTMAYIWRWHGGNMGLGSGKNPYQDAHVRIVLGLLSRHAPQDLFPHVPWHQLDVRATEGVASMLSAIRLWREDAIDFALQFAERAVECWPTDESRKVLAQLQARQREMQGAAESPVLVTANSRRTPAG